MTNFGPFLSSTVAQKILEAQHCALPEQRMEACLGPFFRTTITFPQGQGMSRNFPVFILLLSTDQCFFFQVLEIVNIMVFISCYICNNPMHYSSVSEELKFIKEGSK